MLRYTISSPFSINRSIFIDRSISDTTSKARNKLPKYIRIFRRTKAIPTLRRTCKFALCAFQFTRFPFFTDRRNLRFESLYVRSLIPYSSGDLGRSEEKKTLCTRFDSYDRYTCPTIPRTCSKDSQKANFQARLKITVKRMHFGR